MRRGAATAIWTGTMGLFGGAVTIGVAGEVNTFSVGVGVGLVAWASLGAILVRRQPRNRVAWLLLGAGFLGSLNLFFGELAEYLTSNTQVPLGVRQAVVAFSGYAFALALAALVMLFLLFPNGRLVSSRWRLAIGLVAAAAIVDLLMITALTRSVVDIKAFLENTWSPDYAGAPVSGLVSFLVAASIVFTQAAFLSGAASLLVRLRSASRDERQQVKWVIYSGAVAAALMTTFFAAWWVQPWMQWVVGMVLVSTLAAGFAVALLRYRLYDIDRLINRTVVYGAVVPVLAGVYAAGVFFLRNVLPGEGDLAVAASTLAVAALFNPLRKRIQSSVDRLFYRSRYDAEKVVADFSHRLASEIDLEALTDDWLAVVHDTVKPENAAVWVRKLPESTGS